MDISHATQDCKQISASRPDTPRASGELARPTPPALAADVPAGQGTLPRCEQCGTWRSLPEWEESPSAFAALIAVEHSTTNPNATTCTLLPEVCRPLSIPRTPKPPADAPEAKSDFDWNSDNSVVLHHQPAVAAYINQAGGLTIRQERSWDQDEDIIIAIAPENVGEFIDKLTDVIGIPSFGKP